MLLMKIIVRPSLRGPEGRSNPEATADILDCFVGFVSSQ
jgi:hypothetical protein